MTEHVYSSETRIVLLGRIKVADWRSELRHLELSLLVAEELLAKLAPEENELRLTASELNDLVQGQGEIASVVRLANDQAMASKTLAALTKLAWEYEVPCSIDEVEYAKGDEYFDHYSGAYAVKDGEAQF